MTRCLFSVMNPAVIRLETNILPEQKLLVLMVLLELSELMSHSFPSSSEKGESDRGEPLSFGRKGWRTRRGMRLRGLPFSGDFFSCSKQQLSELQTPTLTQCTLFFKRFTSCYKSYLFLEKRDSSCGNLPQIAIIRLTSYSWNGPIVLHVVFYPGEWWRGGETSGFFVVVVVLFPVDCVCGSVSTWHSNPNKQEPSVPLNPTHYTHTHTHTHPAWYRWHSKPRARHDRHLLFIWPH